MLIWARERAGYAGIDVPGFPEAKLSLWEAGDKEPTLTQAKTLAERYHRTADFFLLPSPPKAKPLPDFRGTSATKPDPALQFFIHQVEARCEWAEEMRRESGEMPVAHEYIGAGSSRWSPARAAAEIRAALSVELEYIQSGGNPDSVLDYWIQKIEDAEIFVFQNNTHSVKSINCRNFRGLALANPYAPAIGLNSQDTPRGKIFTLAHELAHLWIGKAGISDISPAPHGELPNSTEQFCNRVAAEILMPTSLFREEWDRIRADHRNLNAVIYKISIKFKVSQDAVARKAMECGYIANRKYRELHQEYMRKWEAWRERKRNQGGGGGKGIWEKGLAKQAGRYFSKMLIYAYQAEEVNPTVARKLLNASRFSQIDAIAEFHGLLA